MLSIPGHRAKLFQALELLGNSKYGQNLGFKGGTLAYFLYGLDRFSTDLDFNLLGQIDEKQMLGEISYFFPQCIPYKGETYSRKNT